MFNIKGDVRSDQLRRVAKLSLKQPAEINRPIVLTLKGRAELLLQEARTYRQLNRLRELEVCNAESDEHKNAEGTR